MGENMKVRYDPDADILYLGFKDAEVENVVDVDDDVYLEYDKNGEVVGIEIHRVRDLIFPELLKYLLKAKELAKHLSAP